MLTNMCLKHKKKSVRTDNMQPHVASWRTAPVMFCGMTKVPQADGVCRAVVQVITTVNNSYESGKGLRGK